MRFVSVFVAAFLSYRRAISMNPSSPDEVLAYLRVEANKGVAVDLDEAWRLMNSALALAQANGDPGDYTSDIHAGLARIKSKRGGGNVAMVMTGPDGTVRTF